MRLRAGPFVRPLQAAALLVSMLALRAGAAEPFYLHDGQRVLFLGDSITNAGRYIEYIDGYLVTRFPDWNVELINLGLSSETASGLSEPDHPFPRPDVHERLVRALDLAKPTTVVACYGMNDGIYAPFIESRFAAFQRGIGKLIDAVFERGARMVLFTPPPFDPLPLKSKVLPAGAEKYSWLAPFERYDETLERYSQWLLSLSGKRVLVVDVHGPLRRYLAAARRIEPAYVVSPDGIHPDATGHWLIAKALLDAWHAPAWVSRAAIDAASLHVEYGDVSGLRRENRSLTFTWRTGIPMPIDPAWSLHLLEQGLDASGLNRYRLTITRAPGPKCALYEGQVRLGEFERADLERGIDLLELPQLSANRQSRALGKLIAQRERLVSPAWLTRVGHKRPNTPAGLAFDEASRQAAALTAEIRKLARPVKLRLRLEATE